MECGRYVHIRFFIRFYSLNANNFENINGVFLGGMEKAEDLWWLSWLLLNPRKVPNSQEMTGPLHKTTIYQVNVLGNLQQEFVCSCWDYNNLDSLRGKLIPLRWQTGKQRSHNSEREAPEYSNDSYGMLIVIMHLRKWYLNFQTR